MKKLSEVFDTIDYVVSNLAYSKGQYEGEISAEAAKETLQEELDLAKPILESISLENCTKQYIEFEIKKLEICLYYLDTSCNTNDLPLNIILQEYFSDKREYLKAKLTNMKI